MTDEARKARAHAAEVRAAAKARVRKALSRAIDTTGGPGGKIGTHELDRAIYELGRSDERRAMAKMGADARKRPNLIEKMKRWTIYEGVMQGNPQIWRHPHADENLRVLQKALVGAGVKKVGCETIRKDLAEMKRNAARSASQPTNTRARSTPR